MALLRLEAWGVYVSYVRHLMLFYILYIFIFIHMIYHKPFHITIMYVALFILHHYPSCMLHMSFLNAYVRIYFDNIANFSTTFMWPYACYHISYVYLYIPYACFHTIVTYHAMCTAGWWAAELHAGWWLAMIHVYTCYPTILYIYIYMLLYYHIVYHCYYYYHCYYNYYYIYIYKYLHGNDNMNLCKSYFINDIVYSHWW